ncbi:group II intron maturase-specific domain-containing protein [Streptomyces sp. NPDC002928]|uniref:group II intron maturase-specific domain-containing protein n=1 Tax=Streptomyces sp. NPDC002928 TaxID=3154440 RepID=UPI0033B6618B
MERNVQEVADRLGIQVRSAWRYFGAAALAERLAKSAREFDDSSDQEGVCRQVSTNQPLDALLARINPAVRGWCAYFRPGRVFRELLLPAPLVQFGGTGVEGDQELAPGRTPNPGRGARVTGASVGPPCSAGRPWAGAAAARA